MVRKMMQKEVTKTVVKAAIMELVEGNPVARKLEDEVIIGNVSLEKAQKDLTKKHGQAVTVFEVAADTQVYEMSVEDFLAVATLKVEEEQLEADLAEQE